MRREDLPRLGSVRCPASALTRLVVLPANAAKTGVVLAQHGSQLVAGPGASPHHVLVAAGQRRHFATLVRCTARPDCPSRVETNGYGGARDPVATTHAPRAGCLSHPMRVMPV